MMKRVLFLILLTFNVVLLYSQSTVSVMGKAEVFVSPNIVNISIGVYNEDSDAKRVKIKNDSIVLQVLNYLRQIENDVINYETTHIRLSKYNGMGKDEPAMYIASQSIRIRLKKIEMYDMLMTNLIKLNVNSIDEIDFDVSDRQKYTDKVLQQAVLNAKKKATIYANALGQDIGRAIHIWENDLQPERTYSRKMASMGLKMSDIQLDSSVEGTVKIEATVNVEFELN